MERLPFPVSSLPQAKAATNTEEQTKKRKNKEDGLVGLVNIGNSCYMNATLQALSNCPPLRQFFLECHSTGQSFSTQKASDCLAMLFKKMWASERPPGHLSPRQLSSSMNLKMFRGTLQQDAQEFLRCLLTQIHDEIGVHVPPPFESRDTSGDSSGCHRDSMASCGSRDSACSNGSGDSQTKLVVSEQNSPPASKKRSSIISLSSSSSRQKLSGSTPNSAQNSPSKQPKFSLRGSYTRIRGGSSSKSSTESINKLSSQRSVSQNSLASHTSETSAEAKEPALKWSEGDAFVVDIITRRVTHHTNHPLSQSKSPVHVPQGGAEEDDPQVAPGGTSDEDEVKMEESVPKLEAESAESQGSVASDAENGEKIAVDGGSSEERRTKMDVQNSMEASSLAVSSGEVAAGCEAKSSEEDGSKEDGLKENGSKDSSSKESSSKEGGLRPQLAAPITLSGKKKNDRPKVRSIVSEVFEGVLESQVKCLTCKKISVTQEPFQDLSLPIPGRKEMAKFQKENGKGEEAGNSKSALSRGICSVWGFVTALTRDLLVGPPTDLQNCLGAFFDTSDLKGDNRYYCSHCRSFQNSEKQMSIVELPEVLCIHFKRFRFDAYFPTKISRHIAFPLTGLDMAPFLKKASKCNKNTRYELNAVITHYGGAGAGHYVAFAKNSSRNSWFEFNDTRVRPVNADTVQDAEGYVLFYRKIAPSDSQSLQAFELGSLLPKSGTSVPSPDVCYISRHWLHLLKNWADPGPIFQHEYACNHGAVIPTRTEDARSLSMAIRREVWDSLQQRYGGGPLVQKLEVCGACQELLKSLTEKRKQEKDEIHQLVEKERRLTEKQPEVYLISNEWVQQWQKFIHCTNFDVGVPGPVDNAPLLQVDDKKDISLVEGGTSNRRLSKAIWTYFISTYGGGPTIVTSLELARKD